MLKGKEIGRIAWVDNCKGLATLFVVFAHCYTIHYGVGFHKLLSHGFSYFHVSLFFVVAGYLIALKPSKDTFGKFLIKKVKRLLIPLWIWSLAYWLELSLFKIVSGRPVISYFASNLINLVNGKGGGCFGF